MKLTFTILTFLVAVVAWAPRQSCAQYAWVPVYSDDPAGSDLGAYSMQLGGAATPASSVVPDPPSLDSYGGTDVGPSHMGKGKGGKGACGCDSCTKGGAWRSRVFVGMEYLHWWNKGRSLPPLITGGNPANTPFVAAGVLPGAPVVFGADDIGTDLKAGARLTAGMWLDDQRTSAVVARAFATEGDSTVYSDNGARGGGILAIPFNDVSVATPGENALVLSYANGLTPGINAVGTATVRANNDILGAEAIYRSLVDAGCDYRLDLLAGYQFTRIDDDLALNTSFTRFDLAGAPQFSTSDLFDVENEYHAGLIGAMGEFYQGPFTVQVMGKVGIGNMRQTVAINGSNTVVSGGGSFTEPGGIFAQAQAANGGPAFNIGTYSQDQLVWSPEASIKASYCVSELLSISLGYTFQYWNSVALAGDHIDRSVNREVLFNGNFVGGGSNPQFQFRDTDFWVQTIDMGLMLNY